MPARNKKNFRPTEKGAGMTRAGVAALVINEIITVNAFLITDCFQARRSIRMKKPKVCYKATKKRITWKKNKQQQKTKNDTNNKKQTKQKKTNNTKTNKHNKKKKTTNANYPSRKP